MAVFALLIATCGTAGALLLAQGDAVRDRHDKLLLQVTEVERLRAAYLSQAASFQAFLISARDADLADEEEARAVSGRLTRHLRIGGLTAGELAALDGLTTDGGRWQHEAVDPMVALRRTSSDVEVVAKGLLDVDAASLFAAIESHLDALNMQISGRAATTEAAAAQVRGNIVRFAAVFLLLSVCVLVVASIMVRRWITGPLRSLGQSVAGLRAGDLSTVIVGSGPPEIGAMGDELEQMRRRIGVELEATLRSHEGLVQNATVLMSIRARLESPPELLPAGWSVAANLVPATGVVAGDCYDVSWVQPSRLGIIVVDVAGHGAESALLAVRARELLSAALRTYVDLGEGMRWVSRQLDRLASDMFITAFAAILDTVTGTVDYIGAGHPPALLCGAGQVTELPPTGPIIGPFEAVWESGRATIEPGQALVIYTDGLTELRDEDRVEFGLDRLRDVVREQFDDAEAVLERCLAETAAFATDRGHDDVTIVVVSRETV